MDRQATFLLALGLLIAAAACVSASGWVLFAREHRRGRVAPVSPEHHEAVEGH
jgi:hypothetical protein